MIWHEALIPYLPQKQLCGLHMECCGLRGMGWGRKRKDIDYIFHHPTVWLFSYHIKVMDEMCRRGYKVSLEWRDCCYCGKTLRMDKSARIINKKRADELADQLKKRKYIYPEHDEAYLQECLYNLELAYKGIHIDMEEKDE